MRWIGVGLVVGTVATLSPACGGDDGESDPVEDAGTSSGAKPDASSSSGSTSSSSSGGSSSSGSTSSSSSGGSSSSSSSSSGAASSSSSSGEPDAGPLACTIGGAVVAAGALDPNNACAQCDPAVSTTAYSPSPDETTCGANARCRVGACKGGCTIEGAFLLDGAPNPANGCEKCDADVSATTWSPGYRTLLSGGFSAAAQGWTVHSQTPFLVDEGQGTTHLTTFTLGGATSGGQLLFSYPDAVTPGKAFKLRADLFVEAVSPHNSLDAGVALLGSFTAPAGNSVDRAQMVYLDAAAVGWSDNQSSAAFATLGAYHVYELSVTALGAATVSIDGVQTLTRSGYVTNGTVAVGDQTNDANVDASLFVRSVSVCLP